MLVALLAGPLLGERLRAGQWASILGGFGGVLLIARPGTELHGTGLLLVLAAAVCYSIYQIQTRQLSPTENTVTMLFYTALVGTLVMTLSAPLYWSGPWPDAGAALPIAALGVLGGLGHYCLISAFRQAPASSLSPLLYVQMIWAILLGWLLFDHWPDGLTLLGISCIAICSITLAWTQARRQRVPDTDRVR